MLVNHSWDAYNECEDLMIHLRAYKKHFGCLSQKLETDKIYMDRRNQRILKMLGIEIGGKPIGRLLRRSRQKNISFNNLHSSSQEYVL